MGSGIPCPKCGHTIHGVVDTRASFNTIRRRRECAECGTRFTTREIVVAGKYKDGVGPRRSSRTMERLRQGLLAGIDELGG